jgi:hypothetical protein
MKQKTIRLRLARAGFACAVLAAPAAWAYESSNAVVDEATNQAQQDIINSEPLSNDARDKLQVPASAARSTEPATIENTSGATATASPSFDGAVAESALANQRGGHDEEVVIVNTNDVNGVVDHNSANNLTTGSNTVGGGAFSNANGFPMVIQNSGNNVLIQNSTILNLQVK